MLARHPQLHPKHDDKRENKRATSASIVQRSAHNQTILSRLRKAFLSGDEDLLFRLVKGLVKSPGQKPASFEWLAFELATGCSFPSLLRAEEVAKLLGVHVDMVPVVEKSGMLSAAGRPKRKSVKLYVLREVVELRGDAARLNIAVDAIRRRVQRKNRTKKKRSAEANGNGLSATTP